MNNKKKSLLVLVSLVLLLCFGAGSTLAFLVDTQGPLVNKFQPTEVKTTVDEEISKDSVKNNVRIRNDGTTEAYIRAAVIFTWQDKNGNVYGQLPVERTDYKIEWKLNGNWVKKTDGFYYYKLPVEAGKETEVLFTGCKPMDGKAPEGYSLAVEILSSGIQSQPRHVVENEWNVTVGSDGNITGN